LERFYEARDRFLNESHISVVGRMLTNLLLDHELGAPNQSLTEPVVPTDWPAFMTMTASMTAIGDYNELMNLLDTVAHTEYLRITRVSFNLISPTAEGAHEEDNEGQQRQTIDRASLSFEIVMMQDLEQ
jgi:hypothetical protein